MNTLVGSSPDHGITMDSGIFIKSSIIRFITITYMNQQYKQTHIVLCLQHAHLLSHISYRAAEQEELVETLP